MGPFFYCINSTVNFKIRFAVARRKSTKAQLAEKKAFQQVREMLNGRTLVAPRGFDAGFPDFGFRVELDNGRKIDLHFEYKADYKAQMGSMRDWVFNGRSFFTRDDSETKQQLISVMNETPQAITNAKYLLNSMQTYISRDIREIYSGSLNVIRNMDERKILLQEFATNTRSYQIANINDNILGKKIIDHYKTKFKRNILSTSDASVLFMMLNDKVWVMDSTYNMTEDDITQLASRFQLKDFDTLKNLSANLEIRISPRGLSRYSRRASIDVMANFRLKYPPVNGSKII